MGRQHVDAAVGEFVQQPAPRFEPESPVEVWNGGLGPLDKLDRVNEVRREDERLVAVNLHDRVPRRMPRRGPQANAWCDLDPGGDCDQHGRECRDRDGAAFVDTARPSAPGPLNLDGRSDDASVGERRAQIVRPRTAERSADVIPVEMGQYHQIDVARLHANARAALRPDPSASRR